MTHFIKKATEGITDIPPVSQTTTRSSTLGEISLERNISLRKNEPPELLLAPQNFNI